jgi:hypothetical protein
VKKLMIALALYTSGCVDLTGGCGDAGSTVDSGPAIEADAGTDVDASGPMAGTIGSVEACRLLEFAAAHAGLDPSVCPVDCPWPALGGPGIPHEECDPALVIECVDHVANTNDCDHLAGSLALCNVDACAEVQP